MATAPLIESDFNTDTLEELFGDWEIACEVPARATAIGGGTPKCLGDPAEWVAWRPECCPDSPRFLLICDVCKNVYEQWIAAHAHITCGDCGAQTDGFIAFTHLNKAAT